MKLVLDPQILKLFPSIQIGVLRGSLKPVASGEKAVSPEEAEMIERLRGESLAKLQGSFMDVKALESEPHVTRWIKAYKIMGVNPKKSKPTHWALSSRLVKDGKWPRLIGPIIDVYLINQM